LLLPRINGLIEEKIAFEGKKYFAVVLKQFNQHKKELPHYPHPKASRDKDSVV
jgi:hypothetical protein